MLKRLVFVLCLAIPFAPALADDAAFKAADTELNKLYKQIEQRLTGDQSKAKSFTAAQRAWIAFRDAACKFTASGVEGGSVYPAIYSDCLARLTQNRVDDFKRFSKCEEGDMACPVPAAK